MDPTSPRSSTSSDSFASGRASPINGFDSSAALILVTDTEDTPNGVSFDFSSEDDMAKYQEVRDKQRHVDEVEESDNPAGRGVWVGFTFGKNGPSAKALGGMGVPDETGALSTIF